jgi:glutathione peroxidase
VKSIAIASAFVLAAAAFVVADDAPVPSTQPTTQETKTVPSVLQFTMKSLAGQDVNLSQYQGKVILMVNTASKCGNTPQYAPLEALHEKYASQGLAVLGFPSNDFGKQEPGTDHDISVFCTKNYAVTFDMFSKVDVNGDTACDLYKFLTGSDTDPKFPGKITWNFEKFLIGRDGTIIARFAPKTKPDSPEVISAIEAELAKKPM